MYIHIHVHKYVYFYIHARIYTQLAYVFIHKHSGNFVDMNILYSVDIRYVYNSAPFHIGTHADGLDHTS